MKRVRSAGLMVVLGVFMLFFLLNGSVAQGLGRVSVLSPEEEDFVIEDGVLVAYTGLGGEVTLPAGVLEIAAQVFQGNTALRKITFNAELLKIGNYAFQGSGLVGETVIPANVKIIGDYAFQGCNILTFLELSADSIGASAFRGCVGLTEVTLNSGMVGDSAFRDCTGIIRLNLNPGLEAIGPNAFYGCNKITGLSLPATLTSIGASAFYNCTGLAGGLLIPGSVESIGVSAFQGCTGLNGPLTLQSGITTIGNSAFYNCNKLIGDLIIPDSVNSLGTTVFYNCSGFNGQLQLSANLTAIGNDAFYNCSNIMGEVVIPDQLTNIGSNAFRNMPKLNSMVLGAKVAQIGASAFYDCSGITELTFTGLTPPGLGNTSVLSNMANLKTIYVPLEAYSAYVAAYAVRTNARISVKGATDEFLIIDGVLTAYFGAGGAVTIPPGVIAIGAAVFQGNDTLTKITFNEELQTIGYRAFYHCTELSGTVEIPSGVENVMESAFQDCPKLSGLISSAVAINLSAFRGCTGITQLTLNGGGIGDSAFRDCTALISLTINEGVETIGPNAFYGCNKISGLIFPSTLTSIGANAFYNCTGLAGDLLIPGGVETIGASAFQGCTGLNGALTLQDGVITIGNSAFYNCNKLTGDLIIPDSVTSLGTYAFNNCSGFSGQLQFSENLTAISDYAFYGCTNISGELLILDQVTSIGNYAFRNMPKINSVVFGAKVALIGANAFYDCSGITQITFTGLTPPSLGNTSVLTNMANLQTIYVPLAAYDAYVTAYSARTNARISVHGAEEEFLIIDGVLTAYFGAGGEVVIPQGVLEIGAAVFQGNNTLTKITFNEDLQIIGVRAFYGCTELSGTVEIPSGVENVLDSAFYGCTKLSGLISSAVAVNPSAFRGCTGLNQVTLNNGSIGDSAFRDCTGLISLNLNEGVEMIGPNAFYGCNKISGLVLPETLTAIGASAFYNCAAMSGNLLIPGAVETIGVSAFQGCTGLNGGLTLQEGIVSIGNQAFYNCNKLTGDLIIPDSVASLGSSAFYNCSGFTGQLQLSANLTLINDSSFYGCANISGEVVIPDAVTNIYYSAFRNMSKISSVVFGAGLKQIGNYSSSAGYDVFGGCAGVTELTFTGLTVPTLFSTTQLSTMSNLKTVYVPFDAYDAYVTAYAARTNAQITVKGVGDEFVIIDGVLTAYFGAGGEIMIPSGVTEIGAAVFQGNTSLTKVTLNDDLQIIRSRAFYNCTELAGILEIPASVEIIGTSTFQGCAKLSGLISGATTLGASSFQGCGGLSTVTVNGGVIGESAFRDCVGISELLIDHCSIGDSAFRACTGLTQVIINGDYIGNSAFYGCTGLLNLTLAEGVEIIGPSAFYGCNKITGLTIPSTLTSIGASAFYNCAGLTGDLLIPGGVETVGANAFQGCSGLNGELTLQNGVVSLGNQAFYNCNKLTGDLVIPDSVTSLGTSAFYNCSGFGGRLQLSANLTVINDNVFSGCSNISGQIIIPDAVTNINYSAFRGMSKISGVVFGAGLKQIGNYGSSSGYDVFGGCAGVTELTFTGLSVPTLFSNTQLSTMSNLKTVYVPREAYELYVNNYAARLPAGAQITPIADDEDFFIRGGVLLGYFGAGGEVTIPPGVIEIGASVFQGNTAITRIILPEGLRMIRDRAFQNCSGINGTVEIPASVDYIMEQAFQGCVNISELIISSGDIGDSAFRNCTELTELTLNEGLKTIGANAFYGDSKINGVALPASLMSIGDNAFRECTGLTGNLAIPGGVKTIGAYAFYGCLNLNGTLTLNEGITSIGNYAFYNCNKLSGDLLLPDSLTSLGSYAFYNCSSFYGLLKLAANLTAISNNAFYGCSNITGELFIPNKVTTVGSSAFQGLSKLGSVVFGEKVAQLDANAFNGCSTITEIIFSGLSVPNLGNNAVLTQMTALKTVYVPYEAYTAYVTAYTPRVGAGVEFSSDTLKTSVRNLQAQIVYSKSLYLTWSPHTNEAIVKYIIKRDDVFVAETTECAYYDTALITNQTYSYQVYGVTAGAEESGKATVTATPSAPTISVIKTDNTLNRIGETKNTVYIETPNTKNHLSLGSLNTVGLLYYLDPATQGRILVGGAEVRTVSASIVTYALDWDITGMADATYDVVFVLTDADGTVAEKTAQITIDHAVPQKIINVTAIGDISGVVLSWSISSEVDTTRYRIYRRSELDANFYALTTIIGRNILTYKDTTVSAGRTYYYYIVGVNDFGQEGPPSDIATALMGADEEPPQVTKMVPANMSFIGGSATITVTAIDNVVVAKVELYYSLDEGETWQLFASKTSLPFTGVLDTTLLAEGPIRVRALAYDAQNNISDPLTYLYSIDNSGPEKVLWSDPPYTSTSVTITLSWHDVADNDISFFRVERKEAGGAYVKVLDVTKTLGANILALQPDTQYTFRVVGYDLLGNRGTPSDDLIAATAADTTAPVVTALAPHPTNNSNSYYAASVQVSATADDDHAIKTIAIQASVDQEEWDTLYTVTYLDTEQLKKRTAVYTIDLTTYAEGPIFVRAVAGDYAGNFSDSSASAPFVQYIVDRSAPAAPGGVAAIGHNGVIEVMWQKGVEADLNRYSVYRSTMPDSDFQKIASSLATLNYLDRNVNEVQEYFYKVSVNDFAGNESALSASVSAQITADTEAPQIVNVYPPHNERIGPSYRTISIYATDNRMLEEIRVEYKKEGAAYSQLQVFSAVNNYEKTVSLAIPLESFAHDDVVWLRMVAQDKSGNESAPQEVSYIVDKQAPAVLNPLAVYESGADFVSVSWTSDLADDLIGYRVYRKTAAGVYNLIGSQSAVLNKTDYTFTDYSIAQSREQYTYRVDALDNSGNSAGVFTNEVITDNRAIPKAVISCDSVMEVGVEYEIDASQSTASANIISYEFDLGDGATSANRRVVHKYLETGDYTITLTVTDEDGNSGTISKEISVRERAALGYAEIRIVDEDGKPVPNAPVYFDLGEAYQVIRLTNSSGYATFTADAGKHTVGSVIPDNNWLPVKKEIIVAAGETAKITMTLVRHVLIEGVFDIKRLSFEEIVAAGIDVSKPENQYIVNIIITLTYGIETVTTDFYYNGITGASTARPIIINAGAAGGPGGGGNGGGGVGGGGGGLRELTPIVLPGMDKDYITVAILDIPVGLTFLKEFFDVNLTIINYAGSEFSMLDNRITLNVPDGLTIVDTAISEKNRLVVVDEIPGQTQTKITWILRGDQPGEYPISADYVGTLALFNEEITTQFVSASPIKVYGEEGVELIMEYEDTVDDRYVYFNVGFHNYREDVTDAYVDLLSLEVPGAAPYAIKRSPAALGEYLKLADRWTLANWRQRETIDDIGGHLVVYPGEIIWKYYKAPIEVFATYINEDLPWESDSETIGSVLVDIMIKVQEDSNVSIPVRVLPIGTKRTHLIGDGPIDIRFPASDGSSGDQASWPSAYTDAFFRNPAMQYNHPLSMMSLGLALSAFSSNVGSEKARNILSAYQEMEFDEIELHNYDRPLDVGMPEEVAFALAHKTVILGGQEETLVSVVARGSGYGTEWGSNFHLGDPAAPTGAAQHYGFYTSANALKSALEAYISKHSLAPDAKFWMTGYSRGAAVLNIVAQQLTDEGKDVYAYLFATPQTTKMPLEDSGHRSIFNIINPSDIITKLAFNDTFFASDWNYKRYGRDLILPSVKSDSLYLEKYIEAMKLMHGFPFPASPYYQELQMNCLLEKLLEVIPNTTVYALMQNEIAAYAAANMGGTGDVLGIWQGMLNKLGLDYLFAPGLPPGAYKTLGAASYALNGMLINHMPEYYIAWMISFQPEDLFKAQDLYKTLSIVLTEPDDSSLPNAGAEPQPASAATAQIIIKDSAGDTVLSVLEGEIVMQKIAATRDGGLITAYLPGDEDYSVSIIPSEQALLSYAVREYSEGNLTRIVTQDNIAVLPGQNISGSVSGAAGAELASYRLSADEELITEARVSDQAASEINYIGVGCAVTGLGIVEGAGRHIVGQYVSLNAYAVAGGDFLGWYENGALISKDANYLFIAAENRNLEAKFGTAGAAFISGVILYQESPRSARVELYDSADNQIAYADTAENGAYSLSVPTPLTGELYTLVITKPAYLSYTIKNLTLAEGEDLETIDFHQLAGDINGDGFVNSEDLVCLISDFGGPPVNYQYADIDGDGLVNSVDLTCLLAGFGKWNVVVDRAIND